jgi:hypothetical protein
MNQPTDARPASASAVPAALKAPPRVDYFLPWFGSAAALMRNPVAFQFQSPSVSARECQFGVFEAGRHLCPGRGLAYLLVGSALTLMLREFRFALVRKPWFWFELLTAGIARPIGSLRVQVAARS